ncbi:MAG: phospho-N-acetylmuramoyl-pentapeptide-transferase [Clostridiales Family XIII bacterium]|jgi:phospho-N-acetylmuramoyl-pentapeptide-transferase|nr:phospho-N-acetylmuramoyl-pentapeptide-transferase [Clostridiales Family XIII bacterium]
MMIPNAEQNFALSMLIPLAAALVVTALVTNSLIPFLKRIGNLQPIYDEAPEEHKRKQGTPTMGGVAILCGIAAGTAAAILVNGYSAEKIVLLGVMLVFGAIGFIDDYQKITKKRNLGLRARHKFALQLLCGAAFACWFVLAAGHSTFIMIPFSWRTVDIGWWIIPYIVFIMVSMVNAVNLTDGLDGLAAGVSSVLALFFPVMTLLAFGLSLAKNGALVLERFRLDFGDAMFFSAMAGACLGFLLFNRHPAKIFMGDTGSLALGGGFAAAAILCHSELLLPVCGFVFVMEALSDIIQVGSYKLRGGKRVFKMAPLHHHFELSGWSERKVVGVFTTVTLALCAGTTVWAIISTIGIS